MDYTCKIYVKNISKINVDLIKEQALQVPVGLYIYEHDTKEGWVFEFRYNYYIRRIPSDKPIEFVHRAKEFVNNFCKEYKLRQTEWK